MVIIISFRCRHSTDAVDNRGERDGERFDVDHGEAKRIGGAAATSSRHRADFRPRRVRWLALRKRMCRRWAAADQLTQEASIGTQLRASFTTAMRLERRRRSCTHVRTYARTHAARPSWRRQTHNDAFLATRRAMPIKRKSDVDRESRRNPLSSGSFILFPSPVLLLYYTDTSFNKIRSNLHFNIIGMLYLLIIFYTYLFLYSIFYTGEGERVSTIILVNLFIFSFQFKFFSSSSCI